MKKLTPREAQILAKKLGIDIDDEQTTFYATDDNKTEIWSFDSRKERDAFIKPREAKASSTD